METINRPKLSDIVSKTIATHILESNLKPGDKLPSESELTEKLGIGRTSVREGIRQLESVGILTSRQGYGVTLNKVTLSHLFSVDQKIPLSDFMTLSKKEIMDLMDLRLLIELDACRLAAMHINSEGLAKLHTIIDEMNDKIRDSETFIIPDMKFHKEIAVASGNVIYPRIFDVISELFRKQQAIVASLPGAQDRAISYHREILSYLEKRDHERAVTVLKDHLENTKAAIYKNY